MKNNTWNGAWLGIDLAVSVFLFAGIGYFLDKSYNTAPWLMVAGVILGGIVGIWNAYKYAR
ncbi:MAG: AtpZ/AtpI family protein [Candidatus Margulisiibacteriota bacterium]